MSGDAMGHTSIGLCVQDGCKGFSRLTDGLWILIPTMVFHRCTTAPKVFPFYPSLWEISIRKIRLCCRQQPSFID